MSTAADLITRAPQPPREKLYTYAELILRATPGQTAFSKLLPGFEVNVQNLFHGED